MIAKYHGKCRACGASIVPGDAIQYHGRRRGVSCFRCILAPNTGPDAGINEDERAGLEPGTLESDRRLARAGLTVVRTSSGWSGTRNARGRCEDAPCCGCCTF